MTALIIGLIAALGIGGGIAVASNSGGGGHSTPAVSGPAVPGEDENPAANLNPNYDLISFLTDEDQYTITTGTESTLMLADKAASTKNSIMYKAARAKSPKSSDSYYNVNHTIYGNPVDDLAENGHIVGEELENGGYWALNLKAGTGSLHLGTVDENKANFKNTVSLNALKNKENQSSHYNTYIYRFEDDSETNAHYQKIHLGGNALRLTVADFGRWEMVNQNDGGMTTFFMYDEKYAYKGNRHDTNVCMEGTVLVDELHDDASGLRKLFTGDIVMNLNLAANTLTGNVNMHDGVPVKYNIDEFTGEINDSIVHINGASDTGALPHVGDMRGGVGKLLQGKNGLEMVGNLGPQLEIPTLEKINDKLGLNLSSIDDLYTLYEQQDSSIDYEKLRDLFEHGKVDYTFGVKEIKK